MLLNGSDQNRYSYWTPGSSFINFTDYNLYYQQKNNNEWSRIYFNDNRLIRTRNFDMFSPMSLYWLDLQSEWYGLIIIFLNFSTYLRGRLSKLKFISTW